MDSARRSGQDRAGGRRALPEVGLDATVPSPDLARSPGLPRPPAGLRRVLGGRAVPVVRDRTGGPGDSEQARQARTVLVSWRVGNHHQEGNAESRAGAPARDAADGVPAWLTELAAQAPRMAVPELRRPPAAGGRAAAVLILFGDGPSGPDLLLIERAAELRNHAGQPAFPGGAIDEADGGPVRAALREAAEETGLDPAGVRVLAVLPELYIPRSDFRVTPVLAWWQTPVAVGPGDPAEIAAVVRIPIADLAAPANRLMIRYPNGEPGFAFRVAGLTVWGFTALLLDRVLTLGGWEQPWDSARLTNLAPEELPAGWPPERN